ncbi:glycosyltransferase family 4 protein [Chryseolinea lacunae]|uniref:starch synthase n=1 Tax=Chryseolinea lacunae TaxID=2801331 RepID=A0ABS1KMD2_9BACT|nr:glycosyltransferase family 4 protein [Chryseolinea lacunae]MBL0740596.1 glycosyltransferase [Chryseolinea lacunae]
MRVLMFGWEFPPHISGGLGTACQGLTESLVQDGVNVVFVVPKMGGDEYAPGMQMISGADIPIPVARPSSQKTPLPQITAVTGTILDARQAKPDGNTMTTTPTSTQVISLTPRPHFAAPRAVASMTVVQVPSYLTPYAVPALPYAIDFVVAQENVPFDIEESLESAYDNGEAADTRSEIQASATNLKDCEGVSPVLNTVSSSGAEDVALDELEVTEFTTYPFSGAYGGDLMQETARYADVARSIAQHHDHDVIHVHDWMTFPAGLAAKAESGKPLIVHVHSTEFDRSGDHPHPAVFAMEREGLQGADHVVAVSAWTKQILVSRYGISPAKISVVHNGVVPKERSAALARRPGSQVVTFLGRLTFQKGPLYFVQAAFKVLQKFPDTHFIVAGSGDLFPAVVEHVAHLRLSSRFYFTGFLKGDHVDKVWSVSDLYVMPSVSEPFGITPLEAVQAGIPVIVSKQSGVSEVMQHAIKVDFWNIDALANAICTVLAYKSLSSTLRKNSKHEIKNITWAKPARKIKTLYHEITR